MRELSRTEGVGLNDELDLRRQLDRRRSNRYEAPRKIDVGNAWRLT